MTRAAPPSDHTPLRRRCALSWTLVVVEPGAAIPRAPIRGVAARIASLIARSRTHHAINIGELVAMDDLKLRMTASLRLYVRTHGDQARLRKERGPLNPSLTVSRLVFVVADWFCVPRPSTWRDAPTCDLRLVERQTAPGALLDGALPAFRLAFPRA